jgi:hypothetical protein
MEERIRNRRAAERGRVAGLLLAALAAGCRPTAAPPSDAEATDASVMAAAVRAELVHAWSGYERFAWRHDELALRSHSGRDGYESTLLLTPVDALDTLILAGLDDEAARARDAVATGLRFDRAGSVQLFEVTIRVLGGLLSAHELTGDPRLLDLVEELGDRLLPAFDSPTGMPYRYVDLATGATRGAESNPAEIGTLILLWYGEAEMTTGARTATHYGALHAFLPGVLALDGDLERARRLQESGLRMWRLHGIEPEVLDYCSMAVVAAGYPLRPEIIESAYVLHEVTGDPRYREMGRIFLDDLRRHCRTDAGYTVLESVVTREQGDLMPSYFLAETLKYLYLLYAPEALDFGTVVFNTEAHPLRRTW